MERTTEMTYAIMIQKANESYPSFYARQKHEVIGVAQQLAWKRGLDFDETAGSQEELERAQEIWADYTESCLFFEMPEEIDSLKAQAKQRHCLEKAEAFLKENAWRWD
jgi:hypothetical protein